MYKTPLKFFLSQNPFHHPLTLGFFYREKMRAIHRIAPDLRLERILEVGGGQSGLAAMLYPQAQIVNLDLDPIYAHSVCNQQAQVRFLRGDATTLPFDDHSFDAVTMFDVLEHIPNHQLAALEALRVLRPGGYLLVSTPNDNWHFPYYEFLQPICPTDRDMMNEWGHVRRGYTLDELNNLIGLSCQKSATFINPLTALCHDISFSRLPQFARRSICAGLSPLTWLGYILHTPGSIGTETASVWQKQSKLGN